MSLWKPLERMTRETNKFYRNLARGIHTGQRKEMSSSIKDWSMFHPRPELRTKVIEAHHNTPLAGHPGIAKTLELINRNYWWPSMKEVIQHYVKTCVVCQRTKTFPAKPSG